MEEVVLWFYKAAGDGNLDAMSPGLHRSGCFVVGTDTRQTNIRPFSAEDKSCNSHSHSSQAS